MQARLNSILWLAELRFPNEAEIHGYSAVVVQRETRMDQEIDVWSTLSQPLVFGMLLMGISNCLASEE